MNISNLIKVIFIIPSLINLFSSVKATELISTKHKNNSQSKGFHESTNFLSENIRDFQKISLQELKDRNTRSSKEFVNNEHPLLLTYLSNGKKELEIQSQIQSEENNILNAEGNVLVFYSGNTLKADSLIYDKTNKILKAQGNVSLSIGKQLFDMVSFQYDFINKKGYLLDVKGLIKTDNLIDDLSFNFETSNIKNVEIFKQIKKNKVLNTPNKVDNWIIYTDKIEIDGKKWKSKKALFTNDLLELKQVKLQINSLEAISNKEGLSFKSSLNYLILDEKLSIPFWFGNRNLTKSSETFTFQNKWNLGFDNLEKDGYFIGRKFNTINLFNDFVLDIEPQFLVQRSLKGRTKSFVNKGDSINANKVKQDTTLEDYFGLNSQIKGKISNWNLEINKQINSFDSDKFSNSIRMKSNLTKEITFLNSNWEKSFFGIFRDRVWNGSIGEAEIYTGYGSKLEKQNSWEVNDISHTEIISIGLGSFKGEALNNKNLVTGIKGNIFYSLDQKFPITVDNPSKKFINSSFVYIAEPIKKGLSFNTKIELFYSFYENGNTQDYLGLGVGPEFILGDFKKKSFDYTMVSILPFYKIKSGDSMFKFDQIPDKFTLNIAFDQQLYGPLILKSYASVSLDSDSEDYGDFINSKISLNWKKRSYEFGIFYQPHNKSGGIAFTLFGFE